MSLEISTGAILASVRCRQRWRGLSGPSQAKVIAALKALGGEEALVGMWLPEPSLLDVELVGGMIDLMWNASAPRVDARQRRECIPDWTFEEIMEREG
jgi:hypothetical protein